MGLLDNMTAAVNRGADSMSRATEKGRLKSQINEINKKRQGLAAQLGASLYEVTQNDPEMRAGREALYDGIAACDAEREACQQKIDEIDAASAAIATATATYKCVVCGATMNGDDLFCSGCGTPAAQARPQADAPAQTPAAGGRACASCGASMGSDDLFCMNCGAKAAPAAIVVEEIDVTVVGGGEQ